MTSRRPLASMDTHFHLDLWSSPRDMVRAIEAARIYTIAVTNTPAVFPQTERMVARSKFVRPALGFHPELAVERLADLPLFDRYLSRTRYIGEIGLDHVTAGESERRIQRRVLDAVLTSCRRAGDKVLTMHSRRAAADVVDAVGDSFPGAWILHWYSGSRSVLERAVMYGAYVSINSAMASSDRSEALVAGVPRERILTESDGPFIESGGTKASPLALDDTVRQIARWWGVEIEEASSALRENARRLLA